MKTRFLLTALVAMISFVMSPSATAQIVGTEVDIDWPENATTVEEIFTSSTPISVYLFAPAQAATGNKSGFLAMQGEYGVFGVIKDMGQRLQLETGTDDNEGKYAIRTSSVYCQDSELPGYFARVEGNNTFVTFDRNLPGTDFQDVDSYWNFVPVEDANGNTGYQISLSSNTETEPTYSFDFTVQYQSDSEGGQNPVSITVKAVLDNTIINPLIYPHSDYENSYVQCTDANPSIAGETLVLADYGIDLIGNDMYYMIGYLLESGEYPDFKEAYDRAVENLLDDLQQELPNALLADDAITWYIVTSEDYNELIMAQEVQTYINVTGLINDPRFERNNVYQTEWNWVGDENGFYIGFDPMVGNEDNGTSDKVALPYGAYYAAEVSGTGKFTQTVEIPKPGLYAITCQGFYSGTAANANSYLYVKSDLREQQILLSDLASDDAETFEDYCTTLSNAFPDEDTRNLYYQSNVAAGQFLAENDMWTADEGIYLNQVFIKVDQLDGHFGPYTITFGINKTDDEGIAYADNFKLFYIGNDEILFDERLTKQDDAAYQFPMTLNLRRTFTKGAWSPLILPMHVDADQVKQAFGTDAKLSILDNLTESGWDENGNVTSYCINFKKVNLEKDGIEPNQCYIIMVDKEPVTAKGDIYTMQKGNTQEEVVGPIYQIAIAPQQAYDSTVLIEGKSTDEKIDFVGYYAKQTTGYSAGDFILEKGKMYHLNEPWGNYKFASEWHLRVPAVEALKEQGNSDAPVAAKFTMKIDDSYEGDATGIIDIEVVGVDEPVSNAGIYNASGQKVSGDIKILPKGVYIQNGRKFIVK